MTRTGEALIEYQDGQTVDVMYWGGPGYRVQFVRHRVVNEEWVEGEHWVKIEVGYEDQGHDPDDGMNKVWVPAWRVRPAQLSHGEWREDVRRDDTHFPTGGTQ